MNKIKAFILLDIFSFTLIMSGLIIQAFLPHQTTIGPATITPYNYDTPWRTVALGLMTVGAISALVGTFTLLAYIVREMRHERKNVS